jgi:propanol-preferring alcohol dehydrogenase
LDPRLAAPLTDAALTPYHAIKRSLSLLVPGTAAVVIGVGGLGHMAIQLLRAVSPSQVIAVDAASDKLELAEAVGADHVVAAGEGAAKTIRDLTGGRGAQAVFDFVVAQETVALGAAVASVNSQLTMVGLAGGVLPVGFGKVPFECSVSIPYWGSRPELIEVLALAGEGRIKPEIEEFSLEEGPLAYERMRAGKLRGRAVLVPNG